MRTADMIDNYIQRQLDDYWDRPSAHDEDDEDCECSECERDRWEAYQEAKADYEYNLGRDR